MSTKKEQLPTKSFDLEYVAETAYGGVMIPQGTVIGTVTLPAACNPDKLVNHMSRGQLKPVDVEEKKAREAEEKASKPAKGGKE